MASRTGSHTDYLRFGLTAEMRKPKRRVAGYSCISTNHDDQFTSYAAQIDYYTSYIKRRDDLEFVEVYTDEGITGTYVKHQEDSKRKVANTLLGKIGRHSPTHRERHRDVFRERKYPGLQ